VKRLVVDEGGAAERLSVTSDVSTARTVDAIRVCKTYEEYALEPAHEELLVEGEGGFGGRASPCDGVD
jgi:hypothetical protein